MKTINIDGLTCFTDELTVSRSSLSDNLDCLVLESDPTPGYYSKSNFPPNKAHVSQNHLYLPVRKSINCFQDVIYREASRLSEKYSSTIGICPGQMLFQNVERQGIRINMNLTNQLPQIIKEFKSFGIEFFSDKHIKAYTSKITYKKYISFINIAEGVYQDENLESRYYFEIPNPIDFNHFKKGIDQIKNNCDYHLFDAFLVLLYHKNEVRDFIGIYSKHCDENRFDDFKGEIIKYFY